MGNLQPLEVVDRGSESQLEVTTLTVLAPLSNFCTASQFLNNVISKWNLIIIKIIWIFIYFTFGIL